MMPFENWNEWSAETEPGNQYHSPRLGSGGSLNTQLYRYQLYHGWNFSGGSRVCSGCGQHMHFDWQCERVMCQQSESSLTKGPIFYVLSYSLINSPVVWGPLDLSLVQKFQTSITGQYILRYLTDKLVAKKKNPWKLEFLRIQWAFGKPINFFLHSSADHVGVTLWKEISYGMCSKAICCWTLM